MPDSPRAGFDREAPPDEARESNELRDLLTELAQGDGMYYLTQEAAFAPGISGEWPDVIPKAGAKHKGRLVKRQVPTEALRKLLAAAPLADPDYWLARAARLEAALRTCHEVLSEFAWAVREDDTDEGIASRFRPRLGQIREAQETALAALDPEDAAARAPRRGP